MTNSVRKHWLFATVNQVGGYVVPALNSLAVKPITGVMVMGARSNPPEQMFAARKMLTDLGVESVPGYIPFADGVPAAWTDPRTWQTVARYMASVSEGGPFVVDYEPYSGGGYPGYTSALQKALSGLSKTADGLGNQLWIIPGTRAMNATLGRAPYMVGAILNSLLPGVLTNCDESMYPLGVSSERPKRWKEMLTAAKGDSDMQREKYLPGFKWPGRNDAVLQAELETRQWDAWYYATKEQLQTLN